MSMDFFLLDVHITGDMIALRTNIFVVTYFTNVIINIDRTMYGHKFLKLTLDVNLL